MVGEPTLQYAVHKHEGVIICRLVVGEYMVQFVARKTLKLTTISQLSLLCKQAVAPEALSVSLHCLHCGCVSLYTVCYRRSPD